MKNAHTYTWRKKSTKLRRVYNITIFLDYFYRKYHYVPTEYWLMPATKDTRVILFTPYKVKNSRPDKKGMTTCSTCQLSYYSLK